MRPTPEPTNPGPDRSTIGTGPVRLRAAHEHDHGAAVVSLDGEIDLATGGVLRDTLLQAVERETGPLVVDLTDVPFMDSSAVPVFADTLRRLARQDRALAIVCRPGGEVHRLLALIGLLNALTVHGSRDSAVIGGEDRLRFAPFTEHQPRDRRALTHSLPSAGNAIRARARHLTGDEPRLHTSHWQSRRGPRRA